MYCENEIYISNIYIFYVINSILKKQHVGFLEIK